MALNEKRALVPVVTSGGAALSVVSGGVASPFTFHVRTAFIGSWLPTVSVASTRKLCVPLATPLMAYGELHGANGASSSEQRKVAGSSASKVNVADRSLVAPCGPDVIVVCGG